jgi:lysyl-tRNA synthetase class 2
MTTLNNWQKMRQDPVFLEQLLLREQVIHAIRLFFVRENFHEVETPLLVKSPGTEPYLEVFETQLENEQSQKQAAYLLTSPEYAMKKLLVAGLGNIYQICKSFRNQESLGGTHNPEFTILEWYRSGVSYLEIMEDFANLMLFISQELQKYYAKREDDFSKKINQRLQGKKLEYLGKSYDLSVPYKKITVIEAFEQYVKIEEKELLSIEALKFKAQELNYPLTGNENWDELFYMLFLNEIEAQLAKLNQPVIICDYPLSQAALSKKKVSNPNFAERFEVYLAGLELGNAFSELTDANEQKSRLEKELKVRAKLGKNTFKIDQDFINALETGMSEAGGIAVGVDRLVMLFAGTNEIDETLFFPTQESFNF